MEVENQEGQGLLWAVVPLMMMMMIAGFEHYLYYVSSEAL
jgi:hypothetical protein